MDTNYTQNIRLSDQISNLIDSLAVVVGSKNSNFNPGLVPIVIILQKSIDNLLSSIILWKSNIAKYLVNFFFLDLLYYIAQYYFIKMWD